MRLPTSWLLYNPQESILELPRELRQLEQMYRERKEWAADRYPITEHGLLARFNPRTQSQSQNTPAAEVRGQAQPPADSSQPATVESPSTAQVEILQQLPMSPFQSTNASPNLPGGGRGSTELQNDTVGRGRHFVNDQSALSSLPAIGRGFLLQMPPARITQESTGDMKTPGRMDTAPSCPSLTPSEFMPQPATGATDHPKDTKDLRGDHISPTPQSLSSLLRHSFRSFRY